MDRQEFVQIKRHDLIGRLHGRMRHRTGIGAVAMPLGEACLLPVGYMKNHPGRIKCHQKTGAVIDTVICIKYDLVEPDGTKGPSMCSVAVCGMWFDSCLY